LESLVSLLKDDRVCMCSRSCQRREKRRWRERERERERERSCVEREKFRRGKVLVGVFAQVALLASSCFCETLSLLNKAYTRRERERVKARS